MAKKSRKQSSSSRLIALMVVVLAAFTLWFVNSGSYSAIFQPSSINKISEVDPATARTSAEVKVINQLNSAANTEARARTKKAKEKAVVEQLIAGQALEDLTFQNGAIENGQKPADEKITGDDALKKAEATLIHDQVITPDGTLGESEIAQSLKKSIEKETTASLIAGPGTSTPDDTCPGGANVPLQKGKTYATGFGLKEDGKTRCTGSDSSCKLRECVSYDSDCNTKKVVCGDAYLQNPLSVVLPTGGGCSQYTTASGKDAKCVNAPAPCLTASGPIPTGNKHKNEKTGKDEYCFNGSFKPEAEALKDANQFCAKSNTATPHWQADLGKCVAVPAEPAEATDEEKAKVKAYTQQLNECLAKGGTPIFNKGKAPFFFTGCEAATIKSCSKPGKNTDSKCSSNETCVEIAGSSSPDNRQYKCVATAEVADQSKNNSCVGSVKSIWDDKNKVVKKSFCSNGCIPGGVECNPPKPTVTEPISDSSCGGSCPGYCKSKLTTSESTRSYYCDMAAKAKDEVGRRDACAKDGKTYDFALGKCVSSYNTASNQVNQSEKTSGRIVQPVVIDPKADLQATILLRKAACLRYRSGSGYHFEYNEKTGKCDKKFETTTESPKEVWPPVLTGENKQSLTDPNSPWSMTNPAVMDKDTLCPYGSGSREPALLAQYAGKFYCYPSELSPENTKFQNAVNNYGFVTTASCSSLSVMTPSVAALCSRVIYTGTAMILNDNASAVTPTEAVNNGDAVVASIRDARAISCEAMGRLNPAFLAGCLAYGASGISNIVDPVTAQGIIFVVDGSKDVVNGIKNNKYKVAGATLGFVSGARCIPLGMVFPPSLLPCVAGGVAVGTAVGTAADAIQGKDIDFTPLTTKVSDDAASIVNSVNQSLKTSQQEQLIQGPRVVKSESDCNAATETPSKTTRDSVTYITCIPKPAVFAGQGGNPVNTSDTNANFSDAGSTMIDPGNSNTAPAQAPKSHYQTNLDYRKQFVVDVNKCPDPTNFNSYNGDQVMCYDDEKQIINIDNQNKRIDKQICSNNDQCDSGYCRDNGKALGFLWELEDRCATLGE